MENANYDISGFGMPVVDYVIEEKDFPDLIPDIEKHLSYQIVTSDTSKKNIFDKLFNSPQAFRILGGSALSSIRLSNFLLRKYNNFFVGGIGNDLNGKFIQSTLDKEKLKNSLIISEQDTSIALVLIKNNKERQTYVTVAASKEVTLERIKKFEHIFQKSKIIYTDLYLIGYLFEMYQSVFTNGSKNEKVQVGVSLASKEVLANHLDKVKSILPLCDIIFMNEEEYQTLKELMGYAKETNEEFFKLFSEGKANKNKELFFIVTRGKKDVNNFYRNYAEDKIEIISVPIVEVQKDLILDSNGLGDGFAGGFLAGLIMGKNHVECSKIGNMMASKIIQRRGFQLPNEYEIELVK